MSEDKCAECHNTPFDEFSEECKACPYFYQMLSLHSTDIDWKDVANVPLYANFIVQALLILDVIYEKRFIPAAFYRSHKAKYIAMQKDTERYAQILQNDQES